MIRTRGCFCPPRGLAMKNMAACRLASHLPATAGTRGPDLYEQRLRMPPLARKNGTTGFASHGPHRRRSQLDQATPERTEKSSLIPLVLFLLLEAPITNKDLLL